MTPTLCTLTPLVQTRVAAARVLVVGDAMLDRYWYGAVDRISPEAPVPVVRITREEERIGGSANVAYNVVTLNAQASLLTVVGEDEASHKLEALVAQTGIRTHFGRDAALKTTVKLRVIGRQQQLLRLDFENTPPSEVLASQSATFVELLPQHDAVLLSDYGKGGLTHVSDMIALAVKARKPVLVDPKGSDYSRYKNASIITPNRAELQQVVGPWSDEADLCVKVHALRVQLGLQALLLTRSEDGMTFRCGRRTEREGRHPRGVRRDRCRRHGHRDHGHPGRVGPQPAPGHALGQQSGGHRRRQIRHSHRIV